MNDRFASIPSLDRLLQLAPVKEAVARHGRPLVVDELRALLARQRARLKKFPVSELSEHELIENLLVALEASTRPSMRRVFNLTGTVLHTNLGRALLPPAAAAAAARALTQAVNLEYDLEGGGRGERDAHVEALLCRLTGAEAATVVNNNAAAVFLALNTLAFGREVPVSRGELVEIGGSFRVPDIIQSAGCRLREVGTTNRTHLRDFEKVAKEKSVAAILRVHASNYAIVGFVAAPPDAELAKLAHRHKLPFISDLGSGSLVELQKWRLPAEPTPMQALRAGADLVTFSGDKLLGGPQAGIVVGRRKYIERLRKNPLKRALRLDKARIASLEAVLRLYLDPDRLQEKLPTLRLLTRARNEIEESAKRMQSPVQAFCGPAFTVDVAPCASQIGSGSLPVERLPSFALRVRPGSRKNATVGKIVESLRALPIPVIGRVHGDAVWLDMRCLEDEEGFAKQLEGGSS
jgi:L-seryl-tRNA(Ser) seleniumtransferase